jgi:hypothetical protein
MLMGALTRSYVFQRSCERQMEERCDPAKDLSVQEKWLADVAVYPAGVNQRLVRARSTGVTCLLHPTYAELLSQCQTFKSLEEHLTTFCQGKALSDRIMQGLRAKLQQLAEQGYLIPRSLIHTLFQESSEQISPSRITTIGIPTCNRVEAVQRCITSYIEYCQRFERKPDFAVGDDSPSATIQKAYQQMLHTLKRRYGINIAYAGFEEKVAFARKLSEIGKIPEEVAFWTCVGDRTYGVRTTGANRNSLLLHTVGECIFLSDDDLICRVAASPGFKEGLALNSQERVVEHWFYSSRESALESVQSVEQDILGMHEQWLGQNPLVSGAAYSHAGQLSVELAGPDFLRRLAVQSGKIASTAHGIIGSDSPHRPADFLFFRQAESLKRLLSSEQAYLTARTSREIGEAVNQITLTANAHPLNGMLIGGLDNRDLLPPSTPVGAHQDTAFGRMLGKCFPDIYTVYLPWVLLHAPLEARSYSEVTFEVPFYGWLPMLIELWQPQVVSTSTDHLHELGRFLEQIGSLAIADFEEFAHHILCLQGGSRITFMEDRLHEGEGLLASYRQDIEAYCAKIRQNMLLPVRQHLRGGAAIAQRSILQFAQILYWWPTMVETARCLREEGIRLAQPI